MAEWSGIGAFCAPRTPVWLPEGSAQYAEMLAGCSETSVGGRCSVSYPLVHECGLNRFMTRPRRALPPGAREVDCALITGRVVSNVSIDPVRFEVIRDVVSRFANITLRSVPESRRNSLIS